MILQIYKAESLFEANETLEKQHEVLESQIRESTASAGEDVSPDTAIGFLGEIAVEGARAQDALDAISAKHLGLKLQIEKARKELATLKMTLTTQGRREEVLEQEVARLAAELARRRRELDTARQKRAAVKREHRAGAADITFSNELPAFLYGAVESIPVERGQVKRKVAPPVPDDSRRTVPP
ncbi:hypothetical protein ACFL59_13370 [Planctomycetota bacterium]